MHIMPCRHASSYLDRTEYPQYERLNNDQRCRPHAECKVDTDVLSHVRIPAISTIHLGPVFEPHACAYRVLASISVR